jgi:WD40 repeat protein
MGLIRRIVYSAGALGVCVGDKGGEQTLLSGHRGGVSCLGIDPTGRYALTGEGCSGGGCLLWDLSPSTGDSARAITRLGWVHSGGVLAAFFLAGGQGGGRCITVGASGHHEVALWEVRLDYDMACVSCFSYWFFLVFSNPTLRKCPDPYV